MESINFAHIDSSKSWLSRFHTTKFRAITTKLGRLHGHVRAFTRYFY